MNVFEKTKYIIKHNKKIVIGLFICLASLLVFFLSLFLTSHSVIESGSRVEENSELTYYLDILYDGKDKDVVMSSDSATAEVKSDVIYVEDRIPDGLIFKGFVQTSDGTIGAVKRSDNTACSGSVVGGVNGIKYDSTTRVVSFSVKDLQAGCKLTVGIITQTPSLGDKLRMDFYNTAFGRENDFNSKSNTVHVYMGKDAVRYNVSYEYDGDVPQNAPEVPSTVSYISGATVGVMNDMVLAGYTFSGWNTTDVTVDSDGTFTMPSKNVVFKGSFTKNATYNVSYKISGEAPDGYVTPKTKEYEVGIGVKVDSLNIGDVVNGYRFLGWNTEDVTITDGMFTMPSKDVEFVGTFERVKYKVTYKFQGSVIPPNANDLLPAEGTYSPGQTVTVADDIETAGYKFLGWYKPNTFIMPEEDVVIYGEWMVYNGVFSPVIKKEIINQKNYYNKDDIVNFKIKVTNPENYAIKDVILKEKLDGVKFVSGNNYEVLNDKTARIPTIGAGSSIEVNAQFTAGNDLIKSYTNEVEIIGAVSDENYYFDTSKEYKASATFKVSNVTLNINKINEDGEALTGSEFSVYSDETLQNLVCKGTTLNKLTPGTFYLRETKAPSGYKLIDKTILVNVSDSGEVTIEGYDTSGSDGNYNVEIVNERINILPDTGGVGVLPFVLIGVALVAASSVGYIYYKKGKENKSDKEN